MGMQDKMNKAPRSIQPQPNPPITHQGPPLIGLGSLYLSGYHERLSPGVNLLAFLVPGRFGDGSLWVSLAGGDTVELALLINGAEILKTTAVEGMNRFDLPLASAEGDKVRVMVMGGNSREAWWGLQLNQGVL